MLLLCLVEFNKTGSSKCYCKPFDDERQQLGDCKKSADEMQIPATNNSRIFAVTKQSIAVRHYFESIIQ